MVTADSFLWTVNLLIAAFPLLTTLFVIFDYYLNSFSYIIYRFDELLVVLWLNGSIDILLKSGSNIFCLVVCNDLF